jgi:hypothetical protein
VSGQLHAASAKESDPNTHEIERIRSCVGAEADRNALQEKYIASARNRTMNPPSPSSRPHHHTDYDVAPGQRYVTGSVRNVVRRTTGERTITLHRQSNMSDGWSPRPTTPPFTSGSHFVARVTNVLQGNERLLSHNPCMNSLLRCYRCVNRGHDNLFSARGSPKMYQPDNFSPSEYARDPCGLVFIRELSTSVALHTKRRIVIGRILVHTSDR